MFYCRTKSLIVSHFQHFPNILYKEFFALFSIATVILDFNIFKNILYTNTDFKKDNKIVSFIQTLCVGLATTEEGCTIKCNLEFASLLARQ